MMLLAVLFVIVIVVFAAFAASIAFRVVFYEPPPPGGGDPNQCRSCRYDLAGLPVAGSCPECGEVFDRAVMPPPKGCWRWDIWPRLLGVLLVNAAAWLLMWWPIPWLASMLAYLTHGWDRSAALGRVARDLAVGRHPDVTPILIVDAALLFLLARHMDTRWYWRLAVLPTLAGVLSALLAGFWPGNWSQGMLIAFVWKGNVVPMFLLSAIIAVLVLPSINHRSLRAA